MESPNAKRKRARSELDTSMDHIDDNESEKERAEVDVVDGALMLDGNSPEPDRFLPTRTPASSPVHNSQLRSLSDSKKARRVDSSPNYPEDPLVDDIARLLGVGWRRLSRDESTTAAARGWAKFIENNYPISKPIVALERANGYLVVASQGYFFFDEALKEGRLVGTTWETCIAGLQANPIVFEGSETMRAARQASSTDNAAFQAKVESDDEMDGHVPPFAMETD